MKICGLTSVKDAELAAELGADAFGVIFEPSSPRYWRLHPEALDIPKRIGPYGVSVAVFGSFAPHPEAEGFSLVQAIDGDLSTHPHIRTVRIAPGVDLAVATAMLGQLDPAPKAVLIDGYSHHGLGGTGVHADWSLAAALVEQFPAPAIILAGGLTPDNVGHAIELVRPYAIDVSSGVESEGPPGRKDPIKLRDFIQAAKTARR